MQNGDAENKKRLVPLNFGKHHKLIALGLGNRLLPDQRSPAIIHMRTILETASKRLFPNRKEVWKRSGAYFRLMHDLRKHNGDENRRHHIHYAQFGDAG